MEISVAAEQVGTLFGIVPITNSLLVTWMIMAVILVISIVIKTGINIIPSPIQNFAEFFYEESYKFVEGVLGEHTSIVYPFAITFFFFIAIGNLAGLLPGVGSVTIAAEHHGEHVLLPLFRALTADLNLTFALAMIAIVANQYFAIKVVGIKKYLHKFFDFSSPINFFVGMLEIVSEFSKILSFSFRLFGNIFAGEVLLTVIYVLVPFFIPIPFLLMEIFVGLMQAFVFSLLFIVFIKVSVAEH
jgi:F-type H+-transporting ATPase subunit a